MQSQAFDFHLATAKCWAQGHASAHPSVTLALRHAGRCNYVSNAERDDIVVLLKEQLARFQGMPETKGGRA